MLELIGTAIAPTLVALGTSAAWFFAAGRKSGATEQRIKALEDHAECDEAHPAKEHGDRLIRIEEQNRTLSSAVDEVKDSIRAVHKRIDKAINGHSKKPAPRSRR